MFTGIVKSVEQVVSLKSVPLEDLNRGIDTDKNVQRLEVARPIFDALSDSMKIERFANLSVDDSVAINGTCLTIVALNNESMSFDVLPETLRLTNLTNLTKGDYVNVEPALTMADAMGGHQLQGHVDGLAKVVSLTEDESALNITFSCDPSLAKLNIHKGFIALDGISLTITEVTESGFSVMLIPHTQQQTIAKYWKLGSLVNLEVDILSKTIYRYMQQFQR